MAARLPDIAITRNAAFSRHITFYTDKARQIPLDLTGYTGKSELRQAQSSTSPLLADMNLTFATSRQSGTIILSLSLRDLADIPVNDGWFDVLLAPAGAEPFRPCYGRLVISDGETEWE